MAENTDALSGLTVLIIEDEFLIAADVQHIVEVAGAGRTLLASSTAGAHRFLDGDESVDICILDLKLGSEDGFPLAHELRNRGIPFVVATGLEGNLDLADTVIVQKPYDARAVVEALVAALAAKKTLGTT
jgi:DNA-binding response OmpR family regulator